MSFSQRQEKNRKRKKGKERSKEVFNKVVDVGS